MRTYAADDADAIGARIREIRQEAVRQCPMIGSKTLHDCLRSPHRCPEGCPHRGDWIGPEVDAMTRMTLHGPDPAKMTDEQRLDLRTYLNHLKPVQSQAVRDHEIWCRRYARVS